MQVERKFLAGEALGGFFCYRTVLFGVGSGPLVWGRVAAWVMRATQSMFRGMAVRIDCFVDDPLVVLHGTREERHRAVAIIILLWEALGLNLAYHTASWARQWSGSGQQSQCRPGAQRCA